MVAYEPADNVAAVGKAVGSAVAEVGNGRVAAVVALVAVVGTDIHRHQAQLVVARRHASNLCLPGSADAPPPPGPAEQPTWPSSEAW